MFGGGDHIIGTGQGSGQNRPGKPDHICVTQPIWETVKPFPTISPSTLESCRPRENPLLFPEGSRIRKRVYLVGKKKNRFVVK